MKIGLALPHLGTPGKRVERKYSGPDGNASIPALDLLANHSCIRLPYAN